MPQTPWVMTQTWHDLLFAHWPVDVRTLRDAVPSVFDLDLFEGSCWLGIVPFRMTNLAPRGIPSLPWISEFPEVNVRTYVRVGKRPGIYFFSLDAASPLAVRTARALLNLPYYAASMSVVSRGGKIAYESRRGDRNPAAILSATYRPLGPQRTADRGTLEYFLTERYCLYNLNRHGAAYRLDIHHPPWVLQTAEAEFTHNMLAAVAGVQLPDAQPVLHFSGRQDMVAWPPSLL